MIKSLTPIAFVLILHIASAQNVLISNQSNPNETSIMMDPNHPEILIGAANLNNYYISADTGHTWTIRKLTSSYGVWGDPTIIVDTAGHFYFFHLSNPSSDGHWIDRIVCQKTMDNGMNWNDGTYTGLNGDKEQDKQWSVVDRTDNTIYVTWTEFDQYGSSQPNDSSRILFSKSSDASSSWTTPKKINKISGDCIDSDNTVEGAVPAVGPNGEVYVGWAGPEGVVFNKSFDKGETWLNEEIHVDPMPTGWDYHIPGIYRANGLPITVCDLSNGPHRGTLYINWSDQRNGSHDTDIWLAKSNDRGDTWSSPIRVNDDGPGKQQFFTWMTIDQTNGFLYFVFYDRRNHNNDLTDVYVALSTDGGQTFINRKISETPFLPNEGIFFGDYTGITAHDGIVRPIWTRLHDGALSVWTDLTTEEMITSTKKEDTLIDEVNFENYPNPSSDNVYVSYKLREISTVDLFILDLHGNVIRKILTNEQKGYGKYIEKIETEKSSLRPGIYFIQLKVNEQVKTLRQILIR